MGEFTYRRIMQWKKNTKENEIKRKSFGGNVLSVREEAENFGLYGYSNYNYVEWSITLTHWRSIEDVICSRLSTKLEKLLWRFSQNGFEWYLHPVTDAYDHQTPALTLIFVRKTCFLFDFNFFLVNMLNLALSVSQVSIVNFIFSSENERKL